MNLFSKNKHYIFLTRNIIIINENNQNVSNFRDKLFYLI